jgi:hypothetical protein
MIVCAVPISACEMLLYLEEQVLFQLRDSHISKNVILWTIRSILMTKQLTLLIFQNVFIASYSVPFLQSSFLLLTKYTLVQIICLFKFFSKTFASYGDFLKFCNTS